MSSVADHGDSGTVDVTDWKAMHDSVLADCLAREAERDRYREALAMIAAMPTVELNPDGLDQAAWSMQLVAQEALRDA